MQPGTASDREFDGSDAARDGCGRIVGNPETMRLLAKTPHFTNNPQLVKSPYSEQLRISALRTNREMVGPGMPRAIAAWRTPP